MFRSSIESWKKIINKNLLEEINFYILAYFMTNNFVVAFDFLGGIMSRNHRLSFVFIITSYFWTF